MEHISWKNQYIFTEKEMQDMHHMYYDEDLTLKQIADKFGVSDYPIRRIFKEHGWVFKDCHCHARRYSLNENYFDEIDIPNKAFIVGLLYADGYNDVNNNCIKLCLQDTDIQILEDIKMELQYNIPLAKRVFKDHPTWHDAYTLNINSQHISQRLNNLGMVQNKSLILDFPNWISEDLFPFFLKGYIDGDGWVRPDHLGFMGTDKICYGVQQFLLNHYDINSSVMNMKKHYKECTKTWYITGVKHCQQLSTIMFSQPCLGIQRKVQRYIDYGFINTNNLLTA